MCARTTSADLVAGLLCSVLLSAPGVAVTTWYVDADAAGDNNGSSWEDAYTDLQDALEAAAGDDACDETTCEIWVAEGVYKPHAVDQEVSFALVSNVRVYGGFAGNETDLAQRDWQLVKTYRDARSGKDVPV